jgi:quercetin dioxygenase-like cupin family protein
MRIPGIPFQAIDWAALEPTRHPGAPGETTWRTFEAGEVRTRIVEYSAGYVADHWCERGHVVFVIDGEFTTELRDGRSFTLGPGQGYVVSDADGAHRSSSTHGARLFIVD